MTYDASDGYVLLFGGFNGSGPYTPLIDTWAFAWGEWTQLHPAHSPPWILDAVMSYDAADGYVVMFGGSEFTGLNDHVCAQTWIFHAGDWTNLTSMLPLSPSPRALSAATYDPGEKAIVLFGGQDSTGAIFNDTWEFKAGAWSPLNLSYAPGKASYFVSAEAAYSASAGGVVLFGGGGWNETWLFVSGGWRNITSRVAPPARSSEALVPCDSAGDLMLYGGANLSTYRNDTWIYAGGNWTQWSVSLHPIVGIRQSAALDPKDGYDLWFGGEDHPPGARGPEYESNATWTFGPSVLAKALINPDPSDVGQNLTIRDPYNNATTPYTIGWNLGDGNTSTLQSLTHSYARPGTYEVNLSARGPQGVYNNSSVMVAVFLPPTVSIRLSHANTDVGVPVTAGASLVGGAPSFAYRWDLGDGNESTAPNVTHGYSAAGVYTLTVVVTDSAGIEATASATVSVAGPLRAALVVGWPVLGLGQSLKVTTTLLNGTRPVTTMYDGLPAGCPQRNTTAYVCTPTAQGSYSLSVMAIDAAGAVVWSNAVGFAVYPALIPILAEDRSQLDLGQWANLTTSLLGGAPGPDRYSFGGLPPGCISSAPGPDIRCQPTEVGTYDISVSVNDSSAAWTPSNLVELVVNPNPTLSISAAPRFVTVGGSLYIQANVSGGTPPYTYAYEGLPTGCASSDQPLLPCVPTSAGSFDVVVSLHDAAGVERIRNLTIEVDASPPPPSGPSSFPWLWAGVGAVLVVVTLVAIVVIVRNRRRSRAE